MYVLNKLWSGEISPMERTIRPGSVYHQTLVEICEKTEALLETLPPKEKIMLEELEDLGSSINMLGEEDSLLYGFRMGARLMLDIIGDYEGQFRELGERKT